MKKNRFMFFVLLIILSILLIGCQPKNDNSTDNSSSIVLNNGNDENSHEESFKNALLDCINGSGYFTKDGEDYIDPDGTRYRLTSVRVKSSELNEEAKANNYQWWGSAYVDFLYFSNGKWTEGATSHIGGLIVTNDNVKTLWRLKGDIPFTCDAVELDEIFPYESRP